MEKTDELKHVLQDLTAISDRITKFVGDEENIDHMDDLEVILRSISSLLYDISMGIVFPDAIVEMCAVCRMIEQKYELRSKIEEAIDSSEEKPAE